MAQKYSIAKRIIQFLGLRELGASVFMILPLSISVRVYRLMRSALFRDNSNRLKTFEAAFEPMNEPTVDYLELGVAQGTSMFSASQIALRNGITPRLFASDSFQGLPNAEGNFGAGEMAYEENIFRTFILKAGVDLNRLTTIAGFFRNSLTAELVSKLELGQPPLVGRIDCDLYESTVDVLNWLSRLTTEGSVIIFDDWNN